MRIGVPREVQAWEGRVALTPAAVAELVRAGHAVWIEAGAGAASGFSDDAYRAVGAQCAPDAARLYRDAVLIVKVKEPVASEYPYLRPEHVLFSYLHLAAKPDLVAQLQAIGLTAIAFETVLVAGALPLLAPMSDIAGRLAVQIGAQLLQRPSGGCGVLLGGVAGTARGRVVVLGAGAAGGNAVRSAAALGAEVQVFDIARERQVAMHQWRPNVTALTPDTDTLATAVRDADLLIGAVLVPGARAPRLVDAAMIRNMRPGAVVLDIAIDQGGCIETVHPTTYAAPTYVEHGVLHFGVTNMPAAVPRTASQALSAVLLPYVLRLAAGDQEGAGLAHGVSVRDGRVVHPALHAHA
ncbi:MAG TPA: alanine dehydrogenase [Acidiferrobacteraceae bacterium]|nr:alanine dehydrogenase [Acidiferrobacteraceae bacterium]